MVSLVSKDHHHEQEKSHLKRAINYESFPQFIQLLEKDVREPARRSERQRQEFPFDSPTSVYRRRGGGGADARLDRHYGPSLRSQSYGWPWDSERYSWQGRIVGRHRACGYCCQTGVVGSRILGGVVQGRRSHSLSLPRYINLSQPYHLQVIL